MDRQYTSIRISKELREILYKIGRKNETYEDIIRRLIKESGYDIEKLEVFQSKFFDEAENLLHYRGVVHCLPHKAVVLVLRFTP